MLELLKGAWRGWKAGTHALVKGQSWLLMALAYVLALAPIALFFKLFRPDPLDEAPADPRAPSYGRAVVARPQDIRSAQRPW
jgi:hypothetical protein